MLQGRLAQILSKLTSVLCPLAQLCDGDNLQLPKLSSINPSHLTTIVWISDQTNPEIKTDIVKGQEISEAIFLGFKSPRKQTIFFPISKYVHI